MRSLHSDLMEVDELRGTERADKGFGSTDSIPTRALETTEVVPTISFLQADASNNEYFDTSDEAHHARLKEGVVLMSNAIIEKVEIRKFAVEFLDQVKEAAKQDQEWLGRKEELRRLVIQGKALPKQWRIVEEILYYKDRLYIPEDKALRTVIAKGCHDSRVAGHH